MPETHFYGVKLLYRYEVCGEVFYEESILKVKANSFDDALAKAARYADDAIITDHINPNGFSVKESVCDIMDCYLIDESENDSDVQEVYSGIMKNRLDVTDEEFTEQVFDQCSDEELVIAIQKKYKAVDKGGKIEA